MLQMSSQWSALRWGACLLEVLITHGLLTAALSPLPLLHPRQSHWEFQSGSVDCPPFAFDGGLWVWCGKHIQNDKTKMFSFLDLVITNRNKTTTAAKDLWEVRPVQVLKADFLRLDKPSKGLFLEKTLFLTLQPLSACGSSSRVDF